MLESAGGDRRVGIPQGLTVVIAAFLPIMAIVSLFPAVPSLIDHFHGDPTAYWKVPWMVTAPGLSIAIVSPFAGFFIDKFGRRKLVLYATFLYGVLGSAPIFLDSLDAIFVSRLLLGACEGVIMTALNTLVADYWDDDGRRHWLAVQGGIGPLFAGALILGSGYLTAIRWNGVFLVYLVAFPIFVSMVLCMFEPKRDTGARQMLGIGEKLDGLPVRTMLSIGALTLFSSVIYYVYSVNGGLAFREVGIVSSSDLGRIAFIPGMVVMLGSGIFWLLGRAPAWRQFLALFAFLGAGLLMIGLAPDWKWMVAGLCVQQVGAGMTVPTLIAWAQKKLPIDHRGRGMGLWTACFFLGQFVSPPIVTLVRLGIATMQGAFAAVGVMTLGAALVALLIGVARRDRGAATTPSHA